MANQANAKNGLTAHAPISSLAAGSTVDSVYHLISLEQRTKKNGDPYFMLQLGDATGTVGGVIWDNHAPLLSGIIHRDDFVRVAADVGEYNGAVQMTVKKVARVDDAEVELKDFLPVSPRPREQMEKELDAWIARVEQRDCKRLLARLFEHKRLRELYCTAPAAARIHQAYIHGLLEHSLNVMRIADSMAAIYEPVNRSLLITGTLIHDIGKVRELDWKRTITYTQEGRLLGHIPMGASMIDAVINDLKKADGFDEETHMAIIHMILSHHGKLEWGSPIVPKTREAILLHYADHAEAYMTVFHSETMKALARGEAWTGYNKMFDAYLYAGKPNETPQAATDSAAPLFPPGTSGAPLMDDIYPVR